MGDKTGIQWTEATWNPITGCSVVSPGCTNCYAMREAGGRLRNLTAYEGLTSMGKAGPVWNGKVRLLEDRLDQPLRWRKPRRIFVNSMGDLFHESIPDEYIDKVFAVMALAPQHVFQVLTKRADRIQRYMDSMDQARADGRGEAVQDLGYYGPFEALRWPLPNVHLGVSVEDQARAEERIPHLLDTPAAVRWISAEPLLGPVDLERGGFALHRPVTSPSGKRWPGLDWVVAGSESGPGARDCNLDWVRSLRDQCIDAGVAFFWKQHAINGRKIGTPELDGKRWMQYPNTGHRQSAS